MQIALIGVTCWLLAVCVGHCVYRSDYKGTSFFIALSLLLMVSEAFCI